MKKYIILAILTLILFVACAQVEPEEPDELEAPIEETAVQPEPTQPQVNPKQPELIQQEAPIQPEQPTEDRLETTNACGGLAGNLCGAGIFCVYEDGTTTPPFSDAKGTCVSKEQYIKINEVKAKPKAEPTGHEEAAYKLVKGPNHIPINLYTKLNAGDIFSKATCKPTGLWANFLDKEKDGYSVVNRLTYETGKDSNIFMINAGESYILWCSESGILTIEGAPVKAFELKRDANFVVTPSGSSLLGSELYSFLDCRPTIIEINLIDIIDGKIIGNNKESYKPLTQTGDRFIIPEREAILIKCVSDGKIVFP